MSNVVIEWAKANPLAAGAAAVGVLVVVMMVTGGSETADTDTAGGAGIGAYYAAVQSQNQAGAAIQMTQIKEQAASNRALIAAEYAIEKDKIWAPVSTEAQRLNNQEANARLGAEREVALARNANEWHMYDQYVNLENARIASNQNIAFKQANVQRQANKRGFISGLVGAVANVGLAVATGGTSLIGTGAAKAIGGSGAVKLPTLGSSGQWV